MKKLSVILLSALALASCGNSANPNKPVDDSTPKKECLADSVTGDWIVTGDADTGEISDTMGVTLKGDGSAQSINMPTYQYKKWKVTGGDTIVISATSTAEGLPADTTVSDTGIVDLKANTITLLGGDIVYKRK